MLETIFYGIGPLEPAIGILIFLDLCKWSEVKEVVFTPDTPTLGGAFIMFVGIYMIISKS